MPLYMFRKKDKTSWLEEVQIGEVQAIQLAEPASASTIAGLKKLVRQGVVNQDESVVCVATGHILKDPEVAERVDRMQADVAAYAELVQKHSRLDGNVIVIDLRGIKDRPTGNRFLEYTLYPMANVSVRTFDGKNDEFVVCAVGHSIFNRSCTADIGNLLAEYGGGGHSRVGSCQLEHEIADGKIKEIIERLKGT